jgi:hypothetical protein
MSDFPNLEQLGVTSIVDVIKYSLSREERVDVLKIYYKRKANSLLAQSKKYYFARGISHIQSDAAKKRDNPQHVAPLLLLVIEELRSLIANKPIQKRSAIKSNLDDRLNSLEAVIESKLYHLSEQLKKLD